jgi:alkyl hydroperoxide reductase subunit AhpC/rhodanese-related sulfurtransferase
VLDTREPADFAALHLRGSVNVGLARRFAEFAGNVLRPDQRILLVCPPNRAREAAVRLGRIGFDNVVGYLDDPVLAFIEHLDAVETSLRLTAAELAARRAERSDMVLVDVRNPGELVNGGIPGAIHIPLARLMQRADELDPTRATVVYCASGYRSMIAASWLSANGFADVSDLAGGYAGWVAAAAQPADLLTNHDDSEEKMMTLRLNETAPDFEAQTTEGPIRFHEWIGESWAVLFSHPKNYTPVCTTELAYMAKIKPEFDRRGVKIIGLSADPVDQHAGWATDIAATQGIAPNYPLIGDADLTVAKLYDMLPATTTAGPTQRTAADNQTVRNVFVIGPDRKIKLILVYPMTTGRNFDEVLRALDSLQLTATHKVATPANWQPGEDVIIATSVTDDEARRSYPDGWRAQLPYLRIVPQPKMHG